MPQDIGVVVPRRIDAKKLGIQSVRKPCQRSNEMRMSSPDVTHRVGKRSRCFVSRLEAQSTTSEKTRKTFRTSLRNGLGIVYLSSYGCRKTENPGNGE
jgi:hypothetical protein